MSQRGCTALHLACEARKSFTALTLIQFGCDMNLPDKVDIDIFGSVSFYSCVFIVTILYLRAVVRAETVSLSLRHILILLFISAYCANK